MYPTGWWTVSTERIPDATGQRDDAIVREHVAIERVQGGVVEVRREHALPQIVEDDDRDRPRPVAETFPRAARPSAGCST
jgi:hypothetical protein